MKLKIGGIELENNVMLAPMADVTNRAFRQVIRSIGGVGLMFTEMISAEGIVRGNEKTLQMLQIGEDEYPIAIQLFGSNPDTMAKAARIIADGHPKALIDVNMGCPDRHVVANGGGSALIRTPELAVEIVAATKRAGLPVSVKTRLGYSRVDEWQDWLGLLLRQDLAALTVHLRTKKEMSKVGAHFELVPGIVELRDRLAPQTKLIVNGDIKTPEEGWRFVEMGVDGIMIGRGCFANPFCFEKTPRVHGRGELIGLLEYHLDLFDEYRVMTFEPLKRFFKIYVNGFSGAAEVREKLMACKNTDEVRGVIRRFVI